MTIPGDFLHGSLAIAIRDACGWIAVIRRH